MPIHHYKTKVEWTGNQGKGTLDYRSYSRDHKISGVDKRAIIEASSDPSFLGDNSRYNPEELLVSSLSSCHMLWYLHLCAVNSIVVVNYEDHASGTMEETKDGGGRFTKVTLCPRVTITDSSKIEKANALHREANKLCFIANSCNFPIEHDAETSIESALQ